MLQCEAAEETSLVRIWLRWPCAPRCSPLCVNYEILGDLKLMTNRGSEGVHDVARAGRAETILPSRVHRLVFGVVSAAYASKNQQPSAFKFGELVNRTNAEGYALNYRVGARVRPGAFQDRRNSSIRFGFILQERLHK